MFPELNIGLWVFPMVALSGKGYFEKARVMASNGDIKSEIYGVPISERTQRKAGRLLRRFEKKYGVHADAHFGLRARDNEILAPIFGLKQVFAGEEGETIDYERAVFIGAIRMGYGHYRIGMALASAAYEKGYIPYWHDLLGFDSAGARMIRDLDKWYSLGSRTSQKSKTFNRLLWDPLMGKWYKRLEKNYPIMEASAIFADTHRDIPPDTPFLAAHPFNAHGALHAGLKRVVNVVPDNCPLGFHLAPGAHHTVQSPSAYFIFRTLRDLGAKEVGRQGIPADQLHITGHYVDHELVANIDADCAARLYRMGEKAPRRILISIGGAGAQRDLITDIVRYLMPMIRENKAALFINCGDHTHMLEHFNTQISRFKETATPHFEWEEIRAFIHGAADHYESGLHVFSHANPFIAVYTTNLLMRVSDILLTKPSELAFYPIPKLLLERVGGHEAWGAIRASELGDATPECAGASFTLRALNLLMDESDLLNLYCDQIKRLRDLGVYYGAYRAVHLATTGALD